MRIAIIGYGKMGHEVEKAALARQHEVVVPSTTPKNGKNALKS